MITPPDVKTSSQKSAATAPTGIDPGLPLVDLHRHLDGSIRLQTILELADQHHIELPAHDLQGLAPYVHINDNEPGLMAFIARFKYLIEVLVDDAACQRVAYESVMDAQKEGIDYIELRFSPWFMAEKHGLNPQAVVEACIDGIRSAERDTGVRANAMGILSRSFGLEACQKELDAILACKHDITAVDLAGDEAGFPAELFISHFKQVRDAGLHVTVHAGEAAGPKSVWAAIKDLGAERIGHGFRSIEDPLLVEYLVTQGVGLECCPTSNLHISAVPDYASHPIKALADAGVKFCLNTDDPGISNIDIQHEYDIAAPATGLSQSQIHQSQIDGLDMAFLSQQDKADLRVRHAQSSGS